MKRLIFEATKKPTIKSLLNKFGNNLQISESEKSKYTLVWLDTFDWRLYNNSMLFIKRNDIYRLKSLHEDTIIYEFKKDSQLSLIGDFPQEELKEAVGNVIGIRAIFPYLKYDVEETTYSIINKRKKTILKISTKRYNLENSSLMFLHVYIPEAYEKEQTKLLNYLYENHKLYNDYAELLSQLTKNNKRKLGDYSSKFNILLNAKEDAVLAVKKILSRLMKNILINKPYIEKDIDTEFVHDFRVAIRRFRTAITQLKDIFPWEELLPVKEKMRHLGQLTNDLRDLDVYLLKEKEYKAKLPKETAQNSLDFLFSYLQEKRNDVLQKTIENLNDKETEDLLQYVKHFITKKNYEGQADIKGIEILSYASEKILKRYESIERKGKELITTLEDEALHRLRIDCKKLRYLLEFFSSIYPKQKITIIIKQLKKLQDNLGKINDLFVQKNYLANITKEIQTSDSETILAIGCLIGILNEERNQQKSLFKKRFLEFINPENSTIINEITNN